MALFSDRTAAGERLAAKLVELRLKRPLVLALPRGGVAVAAPIAHALSSPLDTVPVRKIGAPFNPEFAVGALAGHDVLILDDDAIAQSGSSRAAAEGVIARERHELERRARRYKEGTYAAGYVPHTVILVDDGLATGLTAQAAVLAARAKYRKAQLIVAVPVCLSEVTLRDAKLVCLERAPQLYAIAQAYRSFPQIEDPEVIRILELRGARER